MCPQCGGELAYSGGIPPMASCARCGALLEVLHPHGLRAVRAAPSPSNGRARRTSSTVAFAVIGIAIVLSIATLAIWLLVSR